MGGGGGGWNWPPEQHQEIYDIMTEELKRRGIKPPRYLLRFKNWHIAILIFILGVILMVLTNH